MSDLPTGWEAAALEDIAVVNPGRLQAIGGDTVVSFVPMPAVSDIEGEVTSPTLRPYAEVSKGYTQFQEGDVIFAKITPCMENGKIAVARSLSNGVACGSTEFHVVRPLGNVSPDFIWRYLRQVSYRATAATSMTGAVGQRRVPAAFLERTALPLPPRPEQQRIVAKIDSLTDKSRRARERLDHIPRLIERYKQAVLTTILVSPRGDIVRARVPLSSITEKITKGSSPNWQGFEYQSQGILFVRSQNVGWGTLLLNDRSHLPEAFNSGHRNSVIKENDVLLNIVGASIGRSVVATAELSGANCNQAVAIIRLKLANHTDARYLSLWLRSAEGQSEIAGGSVDVARANFSLASAGRLSIPWPSEAARRQAVSEVESAFAAIDRLAAEATSARKLLDRLDQSILAKAFRGELVPQDPNDEPASVLLDRIRAERAATPKPKRGRKVPKE